MSRPGAQLQVLEPGDIGQRKDHHLDLCLDGDVESKQVSTGLAALHFEHDALPEIDLESVDTRTELFGHALRAPFVIGAMTGGTDRAGEINAILAEAAAHCGVGMALGSQRVMLERPETVSTFKTPVRPPLRIGNLGAVQLNYGVGRDQVLRLIEQSELDVLAFHLNPLQEAIQPEGDTRFAGLRDKLAELIPSLPVPVLIKEVGAGIGARAASKIAGLGAAGIEVAGVGGTSWAAVEGFRGGAGNRRAGEVFRSFGVPTVASLRACREAAPQLSLVASGGLRTGLDGAKCLALGADAFAMSRPLLEATREGVEGVVGAIESLIRELRIAMFCTGSADLDTLRRQPLHRFA